jgi:hypothetical protein
MKSPILLIALLSAGSASFAEEGHAHVHGVARLDIAVESRKVSLHLDSPLDNLLGFERAPRTDAERKLADGAVARLRAADAMFRFDPAAGCRSTKVELSSAALKLGTPDPAEQAQGHADIDGDFEFECADANKATFVDAGLFQFAPLQRLQVQIATPKGQFRRDLVRPQARIVLTK